MKGQEPNQYLNEAGAHNSVTLRPGADVVALSQNHVGQAETGEKWENIVG